jgi:ketosteroid isomerase-like protein
VGELEILTRCFDAIRRREIDELLEYIDPEIEWLPPPQGTLEPSYAGHDGVRQLFGALFDSWNEIANDIEELIPVGEETVVVAKLLMRGQSSHLELSEQWSYVVTWEGEKLRRVAMYTSPQAGLAAAAERYRRSGAAPPG